jgi:hypothetical protein
MPCHRAVRYCIKPLQNLIVLNPVSIAFALWIEGIPRCLYYGFVVARAVSCQPLIMEAQVYAKVSPCGICGGQSGTVMGFSLEFLSSPHKYHSTVALSFPIYYMGDEH